MTYNGNHLFHYTSLDSAIKIIASEDLQFGLFENLNDIAESKREILSMVEAEDITQEFKRYQSLSFTQDEVSCRGFAINALWGYYADKGRGVCLVFEKSEIEKGFKEQHPKFNKNEPINYIESFTNANFLEALTVDNAKTEIAEHYQDFFFTKSKDWQHEKEYRLLCRSNFNNLSDRLRMSFGGALMAVILCLPFDTSIKGTIEYKLLSRLGVKNILKYTTQLGEKVLVDDADNRLWPMLGVDYEIDFFTEK